MADRRSRAKTEPAKPNALIGSAQILKASRVNAPRNVSWQQEAWGFWRTTPEASFAANWLGHGFSLCRLYVARRPRQPGDEPEPVSEGAAVDLLASLGGGIVGQQELLHSFGVHMTVPGIGYLTGRQAVGAFDSWQVLSADELRVQGRGYEVQVGEAEWDKAPPDTLVIKCWRPDEQFHFRPWSPMQPVLPVLRELDGLSKKIDADIVSRLASAGILLMPEEASFPIRPELGDVDDPFMTQLIEVAELAIKDRQSASANVPVVVRLPGDLIAKVQHVTWATKLDEMATKLREEARGRFAVGMDMPAEVLTGLGEIQHWGQWFLDEQGIKYHIKPGMGAICQGISIGYLHPGLQALGAPDPELMIWFDTSELTTRPDLSTNVQAVYDRFEAGPKALRRETGVDESDAPTPDELKMMVVKKALSEPRLLADPALAKALFEEVGIVLPIVTPAQVPGQPDATPADQPAPNPASPPATPVDVNPPPPALAASANGNGVLDPAMVATGYVLACRALERAGNRVRQKLRPAKGAKDDCPPMTIHECIGGITGCGIEPSLLLEGAWDGVPELAAHLQIDPVWFAQSLELYTAGLLDTGQAHTWENLEGFLAVEMVGAS